MLAVSTRVRIPDDELEFQYVRSSGPGGQNVNKVNSKAVLRWRVAASGALPEDVKARFLSRYASRITGAGEILIASQRFRDQQKNTDDCLERLAALVRAVLVPPKARRATRPSAAAKARRLDEKRHAATKKRLRRGGEW